MRAFPDAQLLIALKPEELGAWHLFVLQTSNQETNGLLHLAQVSGDHLFQSLMRVRWAGTFPLPKY